MSDALVQYCNLLVREKLLGGQSTRGDGLAVLIGHVGSLVSALRRDRTLRICGRRACVDGVSQCRHVNVPAAALSSSFCGSEVNSW